MMKQLLNTLFVMTEDAYLALENDNVWYSRSPYGERGLKLGVTVYAVVFGVSLFLRRAWIEMSLGSSYLTASLCRSPYGECGLK